MIGQFKYGSDIVNIVADATCRRPGDVRIRRRRGQGPTRSHSFAGKTGQPADIEGNGTFAGRGSNGTMRADGWDRIPLIRMTNINLEPGE